MATRHLIGLDLGRVAWLTDGPRDGATPLRVLQHVGQLVEEQAAATRGMWFVLSSREEQIVTASECVGLKMPAHAVRVLVVVDTHLAQVDP
jgi:hypothetical protein